MSWSGRLESALVIIIFLLLVFSRFLLFLLRPHEPSIVLVGIGIRGFFEKLEFLQRAVILARDNARNELYVCCSLLAAFLPFKDAQILLGLVLVGGSEFSERL